MTQECFFVCELFQSQILALMASSRGRLTVFVHLPDGECILTCCKKEHRNSRTCSLCGFYFPTSEELELQKEVRRKYKIELKRQLLKICDNFTRWFRKMYPERDKFSQQDLKDLYEEFNQIPYDGVDEESKDIFRERLSEFLADFFKDGSARN